MYKKIAILLGISFWPLSLFLANKPYDFVNYLVPVLLSGLSFLVFKRKNQFYSVNKLVYLVPLLLIPIFQPKLALLPVVASIADIILFGKEKTKIAIMLVSLLVVLISFKGFSGQTIFKFDHNTQQELMRKIYTYPNPQIARIYQNKARIITDKLTGNFFAFVDPNNYFFGFHPRQITVENQNLKKFPFTGVIFLFFGLYYFSKLKEKRFVVIFGIASLISLSVLSSFDRTDFILWIPLSILFVHGFNTFYKTKLGPIFLIPYFFFTIQELLRILINV